MADLVKSVASSQEAMAQKLELVLIRGDLSKLTEHERVSYYHRVCESLGLNPLTRPLEFIKMNGKEVLYAKKDATDQLRMRYTISVKITGRERVGDIYVVSAQTSTPSGRTDESIGAVNVAGLKGELLANAMMKAETKAKRRATLSICGLGMLDESEVESVLATENTTRRATETTSRITSGASKEVAPTSNGGAQKKPAPWVAALIRESNKVFKSSEDLKGFLQEQYPSIKTMNDLTEEQCERLCTILGNKIALGSHEDLALAASESHFSNGEDVF